MQAYAHTCGHEFAFLPQHLLRSALEDSTLGGDATLSMPTDADIRQKPNLGNVDQMVL